MGDEFYADDSPLLLARKNERPDILSYAFLKL